jgi:hypothetical protein
LCLATQSLACRQYPETESKLVKLLGDDNR